MNILHITTIDEGGAYKAVVRMHEALCLAGMESHILLRNKLYREHEGEVYLDNALKNIFSRCKNLLNMICSQNEIACEKWGSDISKHSLVKQADVLVIHWCNSFLSFQSIKELLRSGKKIVFFMHDTWLFTGGCHVNMNCERYRIGCGKCPYIKVAKKQDLSYKNFIIKQKLLEQYSICIAGPSRWIVECANQSDITRNKDIAYLPNCINGDIFHPISVTKNLKEKYAIPMEKRVVLFGAAFNGIENNNKGFHYLLQALEHLPREKYFLLIFGNCKAEHVTWKHEYKVLGYIYSEHEMAEVYSIADVYVTPSLQESFGFTVCEAMSCGTPVVAFPVGGVKEQIIHKKNGYLAEYLSIRDIANGIKFCTDEKISSKLGENAAVSARRFHYCNMVAQYKRYFESVRE